jgi:4-methylaminobutanoate oxidase (formaldehyde-forming)
MGWERANVFAPAGRSPKLCYSWAKQNWHQWSVAEQRATRSAVALFDQTSFGKILITGRDVEPALQWVCAADVAVEPGQTVYTGLLNARGGYEADVTLTRLSPTEYLLVTSASSITRDLDHLRRQLPVGSNGSEVAALDVTSAYAVYGVMGPLSRDLLQSLSRSDLSDQRFPFGHSRLIDLGHSTVRATRITYVGELGWELYVPTEFAVGVYELLMSAGAEFGVVNAGYYAINSLRLEKGYRAFGSDLTPDYDPIEAGLSFATKLSSGIDFHGRTAVQAARERGPRRRLMSFVLDDPEPMLWGGELLLRDGLAVGQVTSAAWGAAVGASVGLAYVWRRDGNAVDLGYLSEGSYLVDVAGERVSATLHRRAPYDPDSSRIRC